MESGVYLNPNAKHIEQIRAKKQIRLKEKQEKEDLLRRIESLEQTVFELKEILSSKNL